MATLWTDLIEPAELTGYARASLADRERAKGSLAPFLPNRTVADTAVRFNTTENGLIEAAEYRSFDAELKIGEGEVGERKSFELPPLGQVIPVSEYQQLKLRNAPDDDILTGILNTTERVVRSVIERIEYQRGVVLNTGKAVIQQRDFYVNDDFGRKPEYETNSTKNWFTDTTADPLEELRTLVEAYNDENGEDPGSILVSTKIFNSLRKMDVFKNTYTGRPVTNSEIQTILSDAGIPDLVRYDRKVAKRTADGSGREVVKVLPEDALFLLPAPVGSDEYQATQLGATFWGQTLTSTELSWGLASSEAPGLVAGVYRNELPPVIAQVVADAIGMPVLMQPNRAFKHTVVPAV